MFEPWFGVIAVLSSDVDDASQIVSPASELPA